MTQWPGQPVTQWPGQPVGPASAPNPQAEAARETNSGVGGFVRGARRAIENGLTFGFRDELGAAIDATVGAAFPNTGTWSERYARALGQERANEEDFAARNPVTSAAGNFVGAVVAPGFAIAPAVRGAGTVAQIARGAVSRGAVSGGVGGGLAGAGEAEGNQNIIPEAIQGAALGAGLGGVVGGGVSAVAPYAGRILSGLGLRNSDINADRQILRAFDRDRVNVDDLLNAPPAPAQALVDRGGRNTVNLGAVAANTPSEAMSVADDFAQTRRAGRPERVASLVDDTLGGGGGTRILDDMDALRQLRSEGAGPFYERIREIRVPGTLNAALEPITSTPMGQAAISRGLRIMENEGLAAYAATVRAGAPNPRLLFDPETVGAVRGENGQWVLQGRMQNLALLDAIKRGLDAIVEDGRDPVTRRLTLTAETFPINELRTQFRETLTSRFPDYARALEAWSGPTALMDAMNLGQRSLRLNPDQVDLGVRQMQSPGELDAARVGLGRAITDATADPARAVGGARRIVEDRNNQRRLETLIPDTAARERLVEGLRREAQMGGVEQAVSPRAGSQTARLQAGGDDMMIDPPGGVLASLLMGDIRGAARQGVNSAVRLGQGINSSTADALAARMFSMDPAQQQEVLRALLNRRTTDDLNRITRAGLAQALLRGTGATAATLTAD